MRRNRWKLERGEIAAVVRCQSEQKLPWQLYFLRLRQTVYRSALYDKNGDFVSISLFPYVQHTRRVPKNPATVTFEFSIKSHFHITPRVLHFACPLPNPRLTRQTKLERKIYILPISGHQNITERGFHHFLVTNTNPTVVKHIT